DLAKPALRPPMFFRRLASYSALSHSLLSENGKPFNGQVISLGTPQPAIPNPGHVNDGIGTVEVSMIGSLSTKSVCCILLPWDFTLNI
ncbi:MAG TPA: hypothetical protein PKN37_04445, partial [Mesotoga sp.]|nr:hypothetical protein [Mesotoga sp.]